MSVAPIRILSGEVQYVLAALQASSAQDDLAAEYPSRRSSGSSTGSADTSDGTGTSGIDVVAAATDGSAQFIPEHRLIPLFQRVLDDLDYDDEDLAHVPPLQYLAPFLVLLQSERSSSSVTNVALGSLSKLAALVLRPDAPGLCEAAAAVAFALAHCRFEASEPDMDHRTLVKQLRAVLQCAAGPAGPYFADSAVLALFVACFRLAVPLSLRQVPPLLRAIAENTLIELVQTVFRAYLADPALHTPPAPAPASASAAATPAPAPAPLGDDAPAAPFTAASLVMLLSWTTLLLNVADIPLNPELFAALDSCSLDSLAPAVAAAVTAAGTPGLGTDPTASVAAASSASATSASAATTTPAPSSSSSSSSSSTPTPTPTPTSTPQPPSVGGVAVSRTAVAATGAILAAVSNIGPLRKTEVQFLALNMAATIVDVAGGALATLPGAAPIVRCELVPALLRLLAADGTPASVLVIALRTFCGLFACCPGLLKLHLEQFVAVCARVALDAHGAPRPHAPLVLRALQGLFQDPFFVAEVYANYDCDIYCANLLQQVAEFLARAATPRTAATGSTGSGSTGGSSSGSSSVSGSSGNGSGSFTKVHALAVDVLQTILSSLKKCIAAVDRRSAETAAAAAAAAEAAGTQQQQQQQQQQHQLTAAQTVRRIKLKKRLLNEAVAAFNRSAAEGVAFCAEHRIIASTASARDIAVFLHQTPGLDKTRVGEYLCAKTDFNAAVLREYVCTLPSLGGAFGAALREFMEGFVMEGDANIVGRMLEAFAQTYYEHHRARGTVFRSADACYVAAYSVVMLNVDLHNPALKQHMTQEQYIHNSRGINDGADLPRDLLAALYADIRARAFRIPEDFPSGRVDRRTCEDVLARTPRTHPFVGRAHLQDATAIALLRDAFATLWSPLITSLGAALDAARDPAVLAHVLAGFLLCADVAARYALTDVLDYLVVSLCKAAALPLPLAADSPAAALGADRDARRAAEVALRIATAHASTLRDAWPCVLATAASFSACGLLDGGVPDVPTVPPDDTVTAAAAAAADADAAAAAAAQQKAAAAATASARSESPQGAAGWFSALWWGGAHTPREPSREEVLCEQRAKECVRRCDVPALVAACCAAADAALPAILQALFACCNVPQNSSGNSSGSGNNSNGNSGGGGGDSPRPSADSATVAQRQERATRFALDVLTRCVVANRARLALVWRPVFAWMTRTIGALAAGPLSAHGAAPHEPVVAALVTLLYHLAECPAVRGDLAAAFWALAGMPVPALQRVGDTVSAALAQLARRPAAVAALQHAGALAPVFTLLRALAPTKYGHRRGFATLCILCGATTSNSAPEQHEQQHEQEEQEHEGKEEDEYVLTPNEFSLCIGAVSYYSKLVFQVSVPGSSRPQQQRIYVTQCVELVHALFARCTAWDACAQALGVLVELAHDQHPVARHLALSALQRLLLSAHIDRVVPPPAAPQSPAPSPPPGPGNLTTAAALVAAAAATAATPTPTPTSPSSSPPRSSSGAVVGAGESDEHSSGRLVAVVLRRVLLPLVGDYLRPLSGNPDGVNESRVRICALLVAFMLQHLRALSSTDEFLNLLADAMRLLEQHHALAAAATQPGAAPLPGTVVETLPELLKNVLFVFCTSEFLCRDDGSTGQQAWAIVSRAAEKISPGMVQFVTTKLLPQAPAAAPAPTAEPADGGGERV